jgi:hypothetical protein
VTVVATGLGRGVPAAAATPSRTATPSPSSVGLRRVGADMKVLAGGVSSNGRAPAADYSAYDQPAIRRTQRAVGDGLGYSSGDEDLLDIPAFLRRQAD